MINKTLNRTAHTKAIDKITLNNEILTGKRLANAFTNHFFNVTTHQFECRALSFVEHISTDSFFLNPVSDAEVAAIFLRMNNSASRDADGVIIKPIKYVNKY